MQHVLADIMSKDFAIINTTRQWCVSCLTSVSYLDSTNTIGIFGFLNRCRVNCNVRFSGAYKQIYVLYLCLF